MSELIPGGTSTGSKRRAALVDQLPAPEFPADYHSASGAMVTSSTGRRYLDWTMALGSVALGYAHPEVVRAVVEAMEQGNVGPLPHRREHELAERLIALYPGAEMVRFLKTGAEAMAAAVRIARVVTGRSLVWHCGYHGWLDWCSTTSGVPHETVGLARALEFGSFDSLEQLAAGPPPAAIVVEPVVNSYPPEGWLQALADQAGRTGALLVFDEIKTCFRLSPAGAAGRFGVTPHLAVLGKALANGLPLAAVLGDGEVMKQVERTWISSTLAGETLGLAAAMATLEVIERENLPEHVDRVGAVLLSGLNDLAERHGLAVGGVEAMCHLEYPEPSAPWRVTAAMARRHILWKPSAYNFVSLAHGEEDVRLTLAALEESLTEVLA